MEEYNGTRVMVKRKKARMVRDISFYIVIICQPPTLVNLTSQINNIVHYLEQLLKVREIPLVAELIRQHMHATVKCLDINGSKKLQLA